MPDDLDEARLISQADAAYIRPPTLAAFSADLDDLLSVWGDETNELDHVRSEAGESDFGVSVQQWLRAAAVDTGSIEGLYESDRGFTLTFASGALSLEQIAQERGDHVRRHIEAQLEASQMALDAATQRSPITEAWIRSVHEVVCAGQETYVVRTSEGPRERPLPKGAYKEHPNHVLAHDGELHAYAPVHEVAPEMERLTFELSSDSFAETHPVVQSAYAHYVLASIHPFADGNGRVCRLLATVFLMRSASVPLVIFADQKDRYLASLAAADLGDYRSFVRFVRDSAVTTVRTIVQSLRVQESISADQTKTVNGAFVSALGPRHDELDRVAGSVQAELVEQLNSTLRETGFVRDVAYAVESPLQAQVPPDPSWRQLLNAKSHTVRARLSSPHPVPATAVWVASLFIGQSDPLNAFAFYSPSGERLLAIALDEVYPELKSSIRSRLDLLANEIAQGLSDELASKVSVLRERNGI